MAEETERGKHSNIDLIMGDYKSGLFRLAWPMMISMILTMVYNLVDSVWVAGLGADALAAIGFISPIFMILVGLGSGIGVGANSTIARFIGAKDYKSASNTAMHSLILSIIVSIAGAIIMYILLPVILSAMGASGTNLQFGLDYGRILFTLMIVFIYMNVATGILRGEGDVKRSMYAMATTSVINIVLDPIFIYGLNLGIKGAAWATIISAVISCIILFYWTMIKSDTFVDINFKYFSYSKSILYKILNIAIPSTSEMIILSALGICINYILALTSGADAVAVYTVNFRLLQIGMIPLIGFGEALLTLTGASYGARKFKRLEDTYHYAIRVAVVVAIVLSVVLYLVAPYLCQIFAYSESAALLPQMVESLHILCFWIVGTAFGSLGAMLFQGMGKGFISLILTIIRSFLGEVAFSFLFAIILGFSDLGVYYGTTIGCLVGGLISFVYASQYIKRQRKYYEKGEHIS